MNRQTLFVSLLSILLTSNVLATFNSHSRQASAAAKAIQNARTTNATSIDSSLAAELTQLEHKICASRLFNENGVTSLRASSSLYVTALALAQKILAGNMGDDAVRRDVAEFYFKAFIERVRYDKAQNIISFDLVGLRGIKDAYEIPALTFKITELIVLLLQERTSDATATPKIKALTKELGELLAGPNIVSDEEKRTAIIHAIALLQRSPINIKNLMSASKSNWSSLWTWSLRIGGTVAAGLLGLALYKAIQAIPKTFKWFRKEGASIVSKGIKEAIKENVGDKLANIETEAKETLDKIKNAGEKVDKAADSVKNVATIIGDAIQPNDDGTNPLKKGIEAFVDTSTKVNEIATSLTQKNDAGKTVIEQKLEKVDTMITSANSLIESLNETQTKANSTLDAITSWTRTFNPFSYVPAAWNPLGGSNNQRQNNPRGQQNNSWSWNPFSWYGNNNNRPDEPSGESSSDVFFDAEEDTSSNPSS